MVARFKCPRWFAFLDDLPKTAGKIRHFKLRETAALAGRTTQSAPAESGGIELHAELRERVADAMAAGGATAPPSPTPLTPTSAIAGDHQGDRSPRFPNRSIAVRTRKG